MTHEEATAVIKSIDNDPNVKKVCEFLNSLSLGLEKLAEMPNDAKTRRSIIEVSQLASRLHGKIQDLRKGVDPRSNTARRFLSSTVENSGENQSVAHSGPERL